ncbi:hypothetical protein CDAR_548031 [Caerostris darwini]|uniref:Uncharacterized protein n=1 Tax=Caerostris darwini TaxID=1538125 RepID=A0AAV4WH77_9ARAC|nr:hypothetical protein CDAR_548031 [Caerostris darwini]
MYLRRLLPARTVWYKNPKSTENNSHFHMNLKNPRPSSLWANIRELVAGARAENIPSKKRTKRLWEKDAPPTREFGSLTDVEGAGEQCRGNLPPGGAVAMLQWREKERALSPNQQVPFRANQTFPPQVREQFLIPTKRVPSVSNESFIL